MFISMDFSEQSLKASRQEHTLFGLCEALKSGGPVTKPSDPLKWNHSPGALFWPLYYICPISTLREHV